MSIDIEKVKKLHAKWQTKRPQYQKMFNYYNGKTDIETSYKKANIGCNRKCNINYVKKLIDEEVSFAVGNAITYVPELTLDELIKGVTVPQSSLESNIVNNVMKSNVNIDAILETNMLVFGSTFEVYYWKNNQFRIKVYSPLDFICELDEDENVISALHIFNENEKTFMDYFTDKEVIRLDDTFNIIESKEHFTGICPVGYGKQINDKYSTVYNDIKKLQDGLENVISDLENEIGDSRLSYLILKNLTLPDEILEQYRDEKTGIVNENEMMKHLLKNMRDNAIINVVSNKDSDETSLNYLVKNVNADMHVQAINILIDIIYQVTQHINLNQQQASNTSGVALQTRIIALRNKVKMQQNCLTKIIKNRIKAMLTLISKEYDKELNSEKVGIVYNMNIPSDNAAIADIMTKLVTPGWLDAETALSQLSFISNSKETYVKAQEEYKNRIKGESEIKESQIKDMDHEI